nr:OprO/OprP family phosphate-selective porin [Flavihumibacter fluvii]
MDMMDTSKAMGKNMLGIYQKFNFINISGYIQPQFQVISEKGAHTYAGPDFPPDVNNRFTIRRGRIKFDYAHFNKDEIVSFQFAFQFDGSERGVFVRDMWGRVFENKWEVLALAAGVFARPFGYEVNLSSGDRESPERGRMSQILMKTERDIGAMVSFEPRMQTNKYNWLKVDAGFFNGQGLTGPGEYDSYKDFITRAAVKPLSIMPGVKISGGLSLLAGGFMQGGQYIYTMEGKGSGSGFVVDSSTTNIGGKVPRKYAGADIQWEFRHPKSKTVLRAEYWQGIQTALANSSETPATLVTVPLFTRNFNGAFFYLLHQMGIHQLGLKFDWYDPNTKVKGNEISSVSGNFHSADIKYSTLGFGYLNYLNDNLKLVLWYDLVKNESTQLDGYTQDLPDNVLTIRLQFKF